MMILKVKQLFNRIDITSFTKKLETLLKIVL